MNEPVVWIRSALYTWQVGGGGFAAVKYWSSPQFSATYAWLQNSDSNRRGTARFAVATTPFSSAVVATTP